MTATRDTIYALSSGLPPAALAIIRLSGPGVQSIAESILDRGLPEPRRATLDQVRDRQGSVIDEVVATYFAGNASFTGEDSLELSFHGGAIIIEKAFKLLSSHGARLADPGEFTRRAFEAGKLDLTRAEAIADLIDAESEAQHAQALKQFDGALAETYATWRERLTALLALLEAEVDFPDEEDAPDQVREPVKIRLTDLMSTLDSALEAGNITERIREGFRVAIVGPPNAGKSTLLNRLAGREAAIVTDIPGTTRDVVEARVRLGNYIVWFADTAGLRDTADAIEAEGVKRAIRAADDADLRIWLFDGCDAQPDFPGHRSGDLIIANKSDKISAKTVSRETIPVSAKTGEGVDAVLSHVIEQITSRGETIGTPVLTRARHRQAIERCRSHLRSARDMLSRAYGIELIAEEVRLAAREVATLTGAVDAEDILGAVFEQFCIGK